MELAASGASGVQWSARCAREGLRYLPPFPSISPGHHRGWRSDHNSIEDKRADQTSHWASPPPGPLPLGAHQQIACTRSRRDNSRSPRGDDTPWPAGLLLDAVRDLDRGIHGRSRSSGHQNGSSAAGPFRRFGGFELARGDPFEGTVAPAEDTGPGPGLSALSARRAEAGSTPTGRS